MYKKKSVGEYVNHRWSGARGSQDCPLKYYHVQKWESRFTFGLDADKNTYYIKKWFN